MNSIIKTLVFLVSFLPVAHAQQVLIEGIIRDSDRKEALPYASIMLQHSYLGTVSNVNGAFKIMVPREKRKDSLMVSFIGYKSQAFDITDLTPPLIIYLEEDQTKLSEVVVRGFTAESIVKKAIKKIPDNFFSEPFKSKGFYRVTSQKDDSYIHLSEAVFDLYQSKTGKPDQQFKLDKMRAIKDEQASKGIDLGLKPNGIFAFDIVNNASDLELINSSGMKLHDFHLDGTEMIDGQEAYKIIFDQKDLKKSGYKGYMLIDKKSFAFLYFDFGLSPKGLEYHKYGDASLRTMMKLVGIRISMNRNNHQIRYKKFGKAYYLNNVGNDATLTFESEREHYNFKADTRVDYLVTQIETDPVAPFTNHEILGQGKLIEEQNSTYDADFWEDYTIVLPTSDFREIAEKLEANNKANDLKHELEDILFKLPRDKAIRIDSIMSFYNRKNLFNGNALITDKDQILLDKSYNNELTDNLQNSQFRIGSLSKTFTAVLIAQLENQGKLGFNDSIAVYLPHYPNGNITISQLLSHQSGIPNFLDNKEYLARVLTNTYSIEEVTDQFCSDALVFEPGSKFEYSNSNFVLLSLIIEKITGKNYKNALIEYQFKPLEMENTYFGESANKANLVTAFMYGKPEPTYPAQNAGGAGGITSSTHDLLKWSKALDDASLLPKAKMEQLFMPRTAYDDWDAYYGYGWMIDRYMFPVSKKHEIRYHPGTDFGFYSMFVKQPDSGITIILLNNTGEFPRFDMTELILNELN